MEICFNIIKSFLGSLKYDFPTPLKSLFYNEDPALEQNTAIDVHVWKAKESMCYIVDIVVDITEGFNGNDDFHLNLVYSTLVEVEGTDYDESEIVKVLGVQVPQTVYGIVRTLVQGFTLATGFPPVVLDDIDFEAHQAVSNLAKEEEPALGYEWILYDIQSTEEGAVFLQTLRNAYKDQLLDYHELDLYKYYYRFLRPIEYHHPDYKNCDPLFWDIFFQMVFAEADDVRILDGDGDLPEIEFSFPGYDTMTISKLSLEGLKSITSDLAAQAFTSSFVGLYQFPINKDYAETLSDSQPPLDDEIHTMFNYGLVTTEEEIIFTERVCSRIKDYDVKTFPYRLFNE